MNLHIEITKSSSFAGWEGGSFNPNMNLGSSVLLAGPDAEKLSVIYDVDPKRSKNQFLLPLHPGCLVATAQVNRTKHLTLVRVALKRVARLHTPNIQGHAVPAADYEPIWMCQVNSEDDELQVLKGYNQSVLGYRDEFKAFMSAAVDKARTPRDQQVLFWGDPRKTSGQ